MVRLLSLRLARRDHRRAVLLSRIREATRNVFALLAFAAGFLVRPFGALVFGRLGDLVGRKYTFLITILIMGCVDLPGRPSAELRHDRVRRAGGADRAAHGSRVSRSAANTAARRSMSPSTRPQDRRGFFTSWIQTTATLGLLLSLVVIMFTQIYVNANYAEVTTAAGAKTHAVRRLGLAHSVPGLDLPARPSRSGSGCRCRRARPSRR